jgi:hypothetical protein
MGLTFTYKMMKDVGSSLTLYGRTISLNPAFYNYVASDVAKYPSPQS